MLDSSVICWLDNDVYFCWDLMFSRLSAICIVFGVVTMFVVLGVCLLGSDVCRLDCNSCKLGGNA
jgi:hypothetical protein